jgi:hypothetical protein
MTELIMTSPTLNGVGGNPMKFRGIISMELTVGSKSLATLFFIIEVEGNYSVILGYDWIHANRCIASTLHQFLIQWINEEIEVVHADASAYIALADATTDWQHGSAQCMSGKDFNSYDSLSVSKDGFVPVFDDSQEHHRYSMRELLLRPSDIWTEDRQEPRQPKGLKWRILDLIHEKKKNLGNWGKN